MSSPSDSLAHRAKRKLQNLVRRTPPETRSERARREAREFLEARRRELAQALQSN